MSDMSACKICLLVCIAMVICLPPLGSMLYSDYKKSVAEDRAQYEEVMKHPTFTKEKQECLTPEEGL